jgi:hypothetical protein
MTVLLITHTLGGLSYVRTLLMSNPLRIYCAQYLEAHRGSHQADEPPMTDEPAIRLEKDMADEDTPKLKRYFNRVVP